MNTSFLPKDLPPMETEFDVEIIGAITKSVYKGTFKYKIPNISKNSQIAVMESRLNGGQNLEPANSLIHYMLAYLRYTLDEKSLPDWWKDNNFGSELFDPNVITEVYQQCFKFEKEWNEKVHGADT